MSKDSKLKEKLNDSPKPSITEQLNKLNSKEKLWDFVQNSKITEQDLEAIFDKFNSLGLDGEEAGRYIKFLHKKNLLKNLDLKNISLDLRGADLKGFDKETESLSAGEGKNSQKPKKDKASSAHKEPVLDITDLLDREVKVNTSAGNKKATDKEKRDYEADLRFYILKRNAEAIEAILEEAKEEKSYIKADYNEIIKIYAAATNPRFLRKAQELAISLKSASIPVSLESYEAILQSCSQRKGNSDIALWAIKEEGTKATIKSYKLAIEACYKSGDNAAFQQVVKQLLKNYQGISEAEYKEAIQPFVAAGISYQQFLQQPSTIQLNPVQSSENTTAASYYSPQATTTTGNSTQTTTPATSEADNVNKNPGSQENKQDIIYPISPTLEPAYLEQKREAENMKEMEQDIDLGLTEMASILEDVGKFIEKTLEGFGELIENGREKVVYLANNVIEYMAAEDKQNTEAHKLFKAHVLPIISAKGNNCELLKFRIFREMMGVHIQELDQSLASAGPEEKIEIIKKIERLQNLLGHDNNKEVDQQNNMDSNKLSQRAAQFNHSILILREHRFEHWDDATTDEQKARYMEDLEAFSIFTAITTKQQEADKSSQAQNNQQNSKMSQQNNLEPNPSSFVGRVTMPSKSASERSRN